MITLVGHGYIGHAIAKRLGEEGVFAWVRHTDSWNPTGPVINASGVTGFPNVDACESNAPETMEGNVYYPLQVEKGCEWPVVHISSGCVYNGHKPGGWTEEDAPNFTGSIYSLSKVLEQKALARFMDKSYLLRVRMPFGTQNHPKNLLTKFSNYPTLIDSVNSLSRVEDVADVAVWFAQNLPKPGIYNVVNPGEIWTHEIIEMMGLKKEWFSEEGFKKVTKAPRSFCVLNSDKLQKIHPLDEVRTALKDCLIPETLAEPAAV